MNSFDIQITPLITLKEHQAIANLIEIDGLKILFDCGWNETFTSDIKEQYDKMIANEAIDYIFLSNNYLTYFGALPIVMKYTQNEKTQIYATTPIAKLGFYILADAYVSRLESSTQPLDFNDQDISNIFLGINEVKFQQTVKIVHKNADIILTPLPSGFSLGGCSWKISYKLHNLVYSPQYMIEPKLITDPFPYQLLKGVDVFLTDTQVSYNMSIRKSLIEIEFNKKIYEIINEHKNAFIPSDSVNITIELMIRLEKLLDDYYMNKTEKNYKVIVCGYCSLEIIEGVKSLIEFMGSSVAQQFYSYNENPFNFQYVTCVKNMTEYHEATNKPGFNYILIASFFSLSTGMSYQLLPIIFPQNDWTVLLMHNAHSGSLLNDLCKCISEEKTTFDYKEIIILETKEKEPLSPQPEITPEETKKDIQKKEIIVKEKEMKLEKEHAIAIRKKLFAKSDYPMFNYTTKNKYSDYGFELTEKEINQMKRSNQKEAHFQSSFKEFLDNENKTTTNNQVNPTINARSSEFKVKLSQYDIPTKIEVKNISVKLNAKIFLFDLMSSIDIISKEFIISEINPKREVIFLGHNDCHSLGNNTMPSFDVMVSNLKTKGIKYSVLPSKKKYVVNIKENFLSMKFDSSILSKAKQMPIQDYGNVYVFKNVFLRVKRKKDQEIDFSLCENDNGELIDSSKIIKDNSHNNTNENHKEMINCFYSRNDLKLIQIKREIEKVVNCTFFIENHAIISHDKSLKVMFKNGELILDGEFSSDYITLRNFIYSNYMDADN